MEENNIEWYLHAMPSVVCYNGARFCLTLRCQENGYGATYESVSNKGESYVLVIDPFNPGAIMASYDTTPTRALEGLYNFYNQHKSRLEVIYPDPTRWRDAEEVPMHMDATILIYDDFGTLYEEVKLIDILKDYDSWRDYVEDYGVKQWRYKEDPLDTQEDEQEAI